MKCMAGVCVVAALASLVPHHVAGDPKPGRRLFDGCLSVDSALGAPAAEGDCSLPSSDLLIDTMEPVVIPLGRGTGVDMTRDFWAPDSLTSTSETDGDEDETHDEDEEDSDDDDALDGVDMYLSHTASMTEE